MKVIFVFNVCRINDIVLRVNGKPMFNMVHHQAVKELKNAGQRVELVGEKSSTLCRPGCVVLIQDFYK